MDAATVNSILLTASSFLLAGLTAIYVLLTGRLLRESRRANELNQEVFHRQLQLMLYPHINCTAHLSSVGETVLSVQNPGSVPASDVDILIVASYSELDMPPEKFIEQYVKRDSGLKKRLFEGEDEFYGVYDHIVYFSMPQRRQVTVPIHLPIPPENLTILLQFRDAVGVNYYRHYWFFADTEGANNKRFRLGSIEPQAIHPVSRITFETNDQLRLQSEDGSPLPEDVVKNFLSTWNPSIPSGHMLGSYPGVEDRGEWTDL